MPSILVDGVQFPVPVASSPVQVKRPSSPSFVSLSVGELLNYRQLAAAPVEGLRSTQLSMDIITYFVNRKHVTGHSPHSPGPNFCEGDNISTHSRLSLCTTTAKPIRNPLSTRPRRVNG